MWRVISSIDRWVLDKFQRFSDWGAKITGIGKLNYKIAYLNAMIFVVSEVCYGMLEGNMFIAKAVLLFVISGFVCWYLLQDTKRERSSTARKNPEMHQLLRLVWVLCVFPGVILFFAMNKDRVLCSLDLMATVSFICFYYFISCESLPVGKSRVKE
ncbi:hypothetical protein KKC32_02835 [Patescibacteria group bacterium]|nr:hypothetical protein [Patescibacteria group bacterium]